MATATYSDDTHFHVTRAENGYVIRVGGSDYKSVAPDTYVAINEAEALQVIANFLAGEMANEFYDVAITS